MLFRLAGCNWEENGAGQQWHGPPSGGGPEGAPPTLPAPSAPHRVATKYTTRLVEFEAHLPLLRALRTQVSQGGAQQLAHKNR